MNDKDAFEAAYFEAQQCARMVLEQCYIMRRHIKTTKG